MANERKPFGQKGVIRPPQTILHAPGGLPSGKPGPTTARKASLSVGLITLGAVALAGGGAYEAMRHRRAALDEACRVAPGTPGRPVDCDRRGSGGGHGSGGGGHFWGFSSGSSSSATTSSATGNPTGGHATTGGFGHTGAAHAGGGA